MQETLSNMSEEDAKYHMKRCVDSGLWVPDAKKKEREGEDDAEGETSAKSSTDDVD